MNNSFSLKENRPVAIWLLTGVAMIMVQVLLGGITRLTESGLSITEWNPITGIIPPLTEGAWLTEFEKYKHTDQFRYIHPDFSLSDFKFIFFWEWFHRLWARMMGLVFLAGFLYFILKRKFNSRMILPLLVLFGLGALQGLIGWIMVKSGLLPERYFVGHVQLTVHFIAALLLLVYTFWFALKLIVPNEQMIRNRPLRFLSLAILLVFFLQFVYGGLMAGLKAATVAPTWPTINGSWIPATLNQKEGAGRFVNDPFIVQFVHRGLAYLLIILIFIWTVMARNMNRAGWFRNSRNLPIFLILVQALLGILTVLYSPSPELLVWLGVAHQFAGMSALVAWIWILFLIQP